MMTEILFTPASLIDMLSKIDELRDLEISLTESIDGDLLLQIGESAYSIDTSYAESIDVDPEVLDTVEDINLDAYESLDVDDNVSLEFDQPVEAGILKELAKTLLVGGLVRLGVHSLKS